MIIKDNKIFLNKGYGYANIEKAKVNPHTNLKLHPILKAFTGYAILQLVKKERINLK